MKFLLISLLSLSVNCGVLQITFTPATKPINFSQNYSQNKDTIEERIKRIEVGLLPPVIFKNQEMPKWTIAERMRLYNCPGVSVAVINNGEIEWAKGYGVTERNGKQKVTTETLFQAASVSKPVAALAALRLVQEGALKLDEDVNNQLVSWRVPENEFTKQEKVTLRRLLSHTSGLTVHGFAGYAADSQPSTLLQILDGTPSANTAPVRVDTVPGTRWRYSGGGYSVMQQLLSDRLKKNFPEIVREKVLRPLKMKRSNFEQPLPPHLTDDVASGHLENGEMVEGGRNVYPTLAASGMWSTASDLARFAIEIQKSSRGESNKILNAKLTNEMLEPQLENWGLGLTVQGLGRNHRFSHGGSNAGYRAFMVAYTETGQGAVVMTNSDNGEMLFDEILRSIAREYGWTDFLPIEKKVAIVNPQIFESYVGEYQFPTGAVLTITAENGKMYGKLHGNPRAEFFPESETKYFLSVPGNPEITFVKSEKGAVTGFNLLIEGRVMEIKKLTPKNKE